MKHQEMAAFELTRQLFAVPCVAREADAAREAASVTQLDDQPYRRTRVARQIAMVCLHRSQDYSPPAS